MSKVEIFGDVRKYQNKGHDRFYKNDDLLLAGVFDGAGGDELSQEIIDTLPASIARALGDKAIRESALLAHLLHDADHLDSGAIRTATAAMALVSLRSNGAHEITYANAGDSSIYYYDHEDDNLVRLAYTPTSYVRKDGRMYIATDEFLGNKRSLDEIKGLIGSITTDSHAEWSLVGFSDGVQDDDGQGISRHDLQAILREQPAHTVPESILSAYTHYDDASVFVVTNSGN